MGRAAPTPAGVLEILRNRSTNGPELIHGAFGIALRRVKAKSQAIVRNRRVTQNGVKDFRDMRRIRKAVGDIAHAKWPRRIVRLQGD